jgi:hypothetical protein
MVTRVLYIDDELDRPGRDAQKIRDLLHLEGEFECELRLPPKFFSDLPTELPDALLVDLDLSAIPASGEPPVSYFGSTLASEMRMRHPACPIILITWPHILAEKESLLEESMDVDLIVLKDKVNRNPDEAREKIMALAQGFGTLKAILGQDWSKVLTLMGASVEEANLLREAAPPIESKQWNIPQVARWIRNVVMGFPGILYDDLTAATRLGISLDAFGNPNVQRLIIPAKYKGVFSTYKERWWRNRLFNTAQSLILKQKLQGPIFQKFGEAFGAEFEQELDPAICVYDGTLIADWVCYILKKPVKQRNSIPYYPDSRPAVMDQARVSFKAIQESNEFDESLVDSDSYETVVKKLWG